jgi:hypothetical protein
MEIHIAQKFCRMVNWQKWKKIAEEKYNHTIWFTERPSPLADMSIVGLPWVPCKKLRHTETGFFSNADHLDTVGLWGNTSFHLPEASRDIRCFEAPSCVIDIVNATKEHTKYLQYGPSQPWGGGVVFAAQLPWDLSVTSVSDEPTYWRTYRDACKHYGKSLFVKLHPYMFTDPAMRHVFDIFQQIGFRYGCSVGLANLPVIDECDFVLSFNSTFCCDAMLRGVKSVQIAPGYFSATDALTYTAGELPAKADNTIAAGYQLMDFLCWRYAYNRYMPPERIADLLHAFLISDELFPLPQECSYGAHAACSGNPRNDEKDISRKKPRHIEKWDGDTIFWATRGDIHGHRSGVQTEKWLDPLPADVFEEEETVNT